MVFDILSTLAATDHRKGGDMATWLMHQHHPSLRGVSARTNMCLSCALLGRNDGENCYFIVFQSPKFGVRRQHGNNITWILNIFDPYFDIFWSTYSHVDFRNWKNIFWWMTQQSIRPNLLLVQQFICPDLLLAQIFLAWHTSETKCHGGWCLCMSISFDHVRYCQICVCHGCLSNIAVYTCIVDAVGYRL